MERITLFHLERSDIKISMELYFKENGQLFFDGYDIGKTVKDAWGDSDYEYSYTIEPDEVEKLYALFELKSGDQSGLLKVLKNEFSGNKAYSLFGDFMTANKITYSGFSWR